MKRVFIAAVWLLGVYLVARAIIEPFAIELSDSATYRNDWGGPSLVGVLAAHMLPGVLAAAAMVASILRHRRAG